MDEKESEEEAYTILLTEDKANIIPIEDIQYKTNLLMKVFVFDKTLLEKIKAVIQLSTKIFTSLPTKENSSLKRLFNEKG